jgi:hypothetical protein
MDDAFFVRTYRGNIPVRSACRRRRFALCAVRFGSGRARFFVFLHFPTRALARNKMPRCPRESYYTIGFDPAERFVLSLFEL